MDVTVLTIPYDSGHLESRLGRGPGYLLEQGLHRTIAQSGHDVQVLDVRATHPHPPREISTTFSLCQQLAQSVKTESRRRRFPILLTGNCISSVAVVAGLGGANLGILWLDAHGEFNTPETTESGYLDGMGISVMTGTCWKRLSARIPGYSAIDPKTIIHVGGRSFDKGEHERLTDTGVCVIRSADFDTNSLVSAVRDLTKQVERLYVHVDLDVIDSQEISLSDFAEPDGLSVEQIRQTIQCAADQLPIAGVGVAGFDPSYDTDRTGCQVVVDVLTPILGSSA